MSKLINAMMLSVVLAGTASLVFAAPPASAPASGVATSNPAAKVLTPAQQAAALRGPCRADLSVDAIGVARLRDRTQFSVTMAVKNVGTEAFAAPAIYTGAMFQATIDEGRSGARFAAGDISLIQPGASRRFTINIPLATFAAAEFGDDLRAFINYGPDAPRCGIDPNPANDALTMTNVQIKTWLAGTAPTFFTRR